MPSQTYVPPNSTLIQNDISQLRRSARTTQPPHYLQQYYYGIMAQIPSADPISISGKPHSLFSFLSTSQLSSPHRAFTSSVSLVFEPKTYKQANTIPYWQHAMTNEILALEHNQTWDLVPLPHNKSAIGCKWIYKVNFK